MTAILLYSLHGWYIFFKMTSLIYNAEWSQETGVYIQAQVLSRQPLRWRVGRWPGGGPSPPWPTGVLPGAWCRCMCLVCYLSAWVWLRWSCHHPSICKLIERQFRIASLSFLSILLTRLAVIYKKKNLEWIETFFLIWNVNQSICNCKICNFCTEIFQL